MQMGLLKCGWALSRIRSVTIRVPETPMHLTWHGAHSGMSGDAKAEDFGIDQNRISLNSARIFQLVNALGHAGAGQVDMGCKIPDGHATVFEQCGDIGSVDRAEWRATYRLRLIARPCWMTPAGP